MRAPIKRLWNFLRALATDDAYEKYLEHHQLCHADSAALTRRAFYLREQQRKWSGVQRCC